MGFGFDGVHEIWELHGFLNEENWDIVSNKIPVSLLRIELCSEASDISHGILRSY